jgi:hypothetical protein
MIDSKDRITVNAIVREASSFFMKSQIHLRPSFFQCLSNTSNGGSNPPHLLLNVK